MKEEKKGMGEDHHKIIVMENLEFSAHKMTPEELRELASQVNSDQIGTLISAVNENNEKKWKEKTTAVTSGLTRSELLQKIGQFLSVKQALYLIENIESSKLLTILIGISFPLFRQILANLTPKQLQILKQESITEPIQHHLTLFSHQIEHDFTTSFEKATIIERQINELHPEEMDRTEIDQFYYQIEELLLETQEIVKEINIALMIAWNTNRSDLIEKISHIKESYQKYLTKEIGIFNALENNSTGLFGKLHTKLNNVYGNPHTLDIEALRDDEPAIEAIIKFSIWYLEDYWKVGLLPHIKNIEELNLKSSKTSEKERTNHRELLFSLVQTNLEKIGIGKVKDLKQKKIYSRKTLEEYIKNHQDKMV